MIAMKTVHHGGIRQNGVIVQTFTAPSRQKLVYELNSWLFDYFYANKLEILQLPPLDDWRHSTEDVSYWSLSFPNNAWEIWIRHELMEFK